MSAVGADQIKAEAEAAGLTVGEYLRRVMPDRKVVVRLSVNLAPHVATTLGATAARQGTTVTNAVRHAISLWRLVTAETAKGHRLMIVEGEGEAASFREVILMMSATWHRQ